MPRFQSLLPIQNNAMDQFLPPQTAITTTIQIVPILAVLLYVVVIVLKWGVCDPHRGTIITGAGHLGLW